MTTPALPTTRVFAGWYVVGAVFVLLMVNAGLGFYGMAIYLDAITDEQGLSTSSVSLATSLYFIVGAVAGRVIAPMIERHDIRLVVGFGGVVSAIGLLLIGRATTMPMLLGAYVVFSIGSAAAGLVPGTTLITRWFHTRRSVALSIASTGLSVGGLTLTVAASRLIDREGMHDATPWLALVFLVLVSASLLGLFPDPQRRGLLPDGEPASDTDIAPVQPGTQYEVAVRSTFFVLITFAFVASMGAQVGGISQLAKLGSERVDRETGTLMISLLAFTSVLARLAGGMIAARVSLIRMAAAFTVLQGMAMLVLSQADTRASLAIGAVLFGTTTGNLLMLQPLLVADRFGVTNYPRIFALNQLIIMGVGVSGGPYLLGSLHDLESYTLSYGAAAVLTWIGTMAFVAAARLPDDGEVDSPTRDTITTGS